MHWAACKYTVHLFILFSESHSLATKPFSLILSDNEEKRLTDWLVLSSCSMSCCRANILQILWDPENWPLHSLLDLAHYVLEEMIFTCWLAKLVDGNKLKVTDSASRLSACGHACLDYSSASCILGSCDGESNFLHHICLCFYPAVCVRGHGDRQHINS